MEIEPDLAEMAGGRGWLAVSSRSAPIRSGLSERHERRAIKQFAKSAEK